MRSLISHRTLRSPYYRYRCIAWLACPSIAHTHHIPHAVLPTAARLLPFCQPFRLSAVTRVSTASTTSLPGATVTPATKKDTGIIPSPRDTLGRRLCKHDHISPAVTPDREIQHDANEKDATVELIYCLCFVLSRPA
ncbi:hypothetical protein M422DRAFT_34953 [Sphaerobolus stellatus SS14]|uniref:Uncharacterized protein n=1 Tax=Sphaerobolus stellatus (strain SS14) TaxID=990650 RepID=A0A0C9VBL3_SPHS4|nr:hypothetical protein M422DRAFT_34953 [Sphaerobolus stellatus SS14]